MERIRRAIKLSECISSSRNATFTTLSFCPSWPRKDGQVNDDSPLCFLRCRWYPSQGASKQPYSVGVCLDNRTGQPYRAHCRCVSGLGEACSPVAGLLFALEDFISRSFTKLPDEESTTDILCSWSKPSRSRRVEPMPLSKIPIRKAVSGGRKENTKREREYFVSKYDPHHSLDRKVDMAAAAELASGMKRCLGDCGFRRNWDDTQSRKTLKVVRDVSAGLLSSCRSVLLMNELPLCQKLRLGPA